jgi:hypothetical protein
MKKKWNDELLIKAVKEVNSFNELFKFFGVSNSNSLRVRVKTLNLNTSHWFRSQSKPRAHKLSLDQVLVEHSLYTCSSALKKKF